MCSPGHSPSARALGGGRRGSAAVDPRAPTRAGAPTRSRSRLSSCAYKASLRPEPWKSTSGEAGGGKSFGTGTARGLELPGPPRRGGAGWGGASPAELRKAAPRLVTNPFCPEAPRISQRRLRLLLLFQLFHSSHLILQTTKPRIGEFWCRAYTAYTAGLPTLQYSLHSRPPPLKIVIVNIY